MPRQKDTKWQITPDTNGKYSMEAAHLAVLMDIRDELKAINALLNCHNIQQMFNNIRKIDTRLLKAGFKLQRTSDEKAN